MGSQRLRIYAHGSPSTFGLDIDGKPCAVASRIELVLDANGRSEARISVPLELVDVDVNVEAFVKYYRGQPVPMSADDVEAAARDHLLIREMGWTWQQLHEVAPYVRKAIWHAIKPGTEDH